MPRCRSCRYLGGIYDSICGLDGKRIPCPPSGWCHRAPPGLVGPDASCFPPVKFDHWCGEHRYSLAGILRAVKAYLGRPWFKRRTKVSDVAVTSITSKFEDPFGSPAEFNKHFEEAVKQLGAGAVMVSSTTVPTVTAERKPHLHPETEEPLLHPTTGEPMTFETGEAVTTYTLTTNWHSATS